MNYLMEKKISLLDREAFHQILLWAVECNASDVHIQPFMPIYAQINQKLEKIHNLTPNESETSLLVNSLFGDHAIGVLAQGNEGLNDDYSIKVDRFNKQRFRLNATPCHVQGADGVQITARVIKQEPANIVDLGIEQEIIDTLKLRQGLVLVTGTMGTGKTTLLSALVRHMLEDKGLGRKILTAESPIEYVYDSVEWKSNSFVSQLSIPRQLKTFHAAVVEATRRMPHVFVLGEAREIDTFRAVVQASQLGMLVLTTLHTNSAAETLNRIINQFPESEQSFQKANIVDSLRMIVSQTLLPSTQGGLVALREILPLNEISVRNELMKTPVENISSVARSLVTEHGKSMYADARIKYDQGLITDYHLDYVKYSFGEY